MAEEQRTIWEFHARFAEGKPLDDLLETIRSKFQDSVVLRYYAGMWHAKCTDYSSAIDEFGASLRLDPSFAPAALACARSLASMPHPDVGRIKRLLEPYWNVPTLDATPGSASVGCLRYEPLVDYEICAIMGPLLPASDAFKLYRELYARNFRPPHLCFLLGSAALECDVERAGEYFLAGFQASRLPELAQAALVSSHYQLNPSLPEREDVQNAFAYRGPLGLAPRLRKHRIHLGYLSPDFNKNAVGLFATPLLKHHDSHEFKVFVYYLNPEEDEFTELFRSYPNVTWRDVARLSTPQIHSLMTREDGLDVLVDLLGPGYGGRMELLTTKPAPCIVNYLGYPGSYALKEVTHRLTDALADPIGVQWTGPERLVRMDRCFLCYHLFDSVRMPDLAVPAGDRIYVGIFQKQLKHHPFVKTLWAEICAKNPNIQLCIKLGQGQTPEDFRGFPGARFVPFTDSLEAYLDHYNSLDFCLDTYPYSGTTTTCSSLLMGVPVLTLSLPGARHVSNVTTSLLMHVSAEEYGGYVCRSAQEYVAQAIEAPRNRDLAVRQKRRAAFLEHMNPTDFMDGYEAMLKSVVYGADGNRPL